MENKTGSGRLSVWLPLLMGICVAVGMFFGFKMRDGMADNNFFHTPKSSPLEEVLSLISKKYVDSVNLKKLGDTAIYAVLAKLDPHSVFIPARDMDRINEEINGSFYGIGIEFNIYDDTVNVVNVLNDGPASKAGLIIGDRIFKIGDSVIAGKKLESESIRKIMRGPLNSVVRLTVVRNKKQIMVPVVRGVIPINSLDAAYMVDDKTGYIRLNMFNNNTYREFMQSIAKLKKQNLQQLILDLRDNGGGVLDEAVEIADEFLAGDKLITYTEGRSYPRKEFRCRRLGQFETGKLIILANEGTASASEILMGALQDWDRATIIGRRTFGKGLVQEPFNLSDKSSLRLTVARYFTPLGRSIQRSYATGNKQYFQEITERYTNGHSNFSDSVKNVSGKVYTTPRGNKIFGGGGISPDYFIAADTSRMGLVSAKLFSKGIFENIGYKYYIAHPDLKSRFKNADSFTRGFRIDGKVWAFLDSLAQKDSIDIENVLPKERESIDQILKSSIARQIYGTEGFFEVQNQFDSGFKKAMEILH